MSKTGAIIAVILGIAIVFLSLWVRELKDDVADRDCTIKQLNKTNGELSAANQTLINSVKDEREASAKRASKIAELEQQLRDRKGKYDEATKDDSCANTVAPSAVLDLMR
ncbi:hypothetical protein [Escherichia phage AV127]|nr:hypothetical protein [Escherichia phage AV127]